MSFARQDAARRGVDEIMIIGGGDVFERMLPTADRLEITHVHASPEGDAFFPHLEPADWREIKRMSYPAGPDDDAALRRGDLRVRRGARRGMRLDQFDPVTERIVDVAAVAAFKRLVGGDGVA